MIIDNVLFRKCVKFTLYASNSRVNDKQRLFNAKNASISRIAFKRTETVFLGIFHSIRHGYTKRQSKRLETGFPAQETPNQRNDNPAKQRKQL
jgi:hypothetical protein